MSKLWPNTKKFTSTPGARTFLPDDYVRRKREMRTNITSMLLFAAVMAGVSGAFIVTNRQWNGVLEEQRQVGAEYDAEAIKIEQLNQLEAQRKDMLERADVAATLLEKVPRSILLAEIVNRMPDRMTLTEMNLQSKRIAEPPPAVSKDANQPKSLSVKPGAAGAGAQANAKPAKPPEPKPAKLEFSLVLTGVASTDADVADFQASLRECPLLRGVEWKESKSTVIDENSLRQFVIEAQIRPNADTRTLNPKLADKTTPTAVAGFSTQDMGPKESPAIEKTATVPTP
ncbi:hypothetical protein BH11PLA1_BH11PLA1_18940 [soil metagenome]